MHSNRIAYINGKVLNKDSLSIDEMVDLFKIRGLSILNESEFSKHLEKCNYFDVTDYKRVLGVLDDNYSGLSDIDLIKTKDLNDKLLSIIFEYTRYFEEKLRTEFAYVLAQVDKFYLEDNSNFKTGINSNKLQNKISNKMTMTEDYITHFTHTGNQVPIWALIKALTFNEIEWCLNRFNKAKDAKDILENTLNSRHSTRTLQHIKFIHVIRKTRNICAHYDRLLGQEISIPNIDSIHTMYTRSCFGVIYILSEYYLEEKMAKELVHRTFTLFSKHDKFINNKFTNYNNFLDEYTEFKSYHSMLGCNKVIFKIKFLLNQLYKL